MVPPPNSDRPEGAEPDDSRLAFLPLGLIALAIVQPNLAEAERRIEEARRTQAKSLDLGDLALSELPASLGDLPQLRALFLGWAKPNEVGGLSWDYKREQSRFTDLSPLSGLAGLQSLDLSSTGVTDLSPLSGLAGLQILNLWGTGVTDLWPLSGLKGLQRLNLTSTRVADLSPLSGLTGLQSLDLSETSVTDLSQLSGLTGLQSLDLWNTGVTDLSPLSGLKGLQSLNLVGTDVVDLSPLSGLAGLQSLSLLGTSVTDLSLLSGLAGLQSLSLWSTVITDLSLLSGLADLRILELWSTDVTDLSPLSGLAGLQILDLSETGVTDLSPLSGLIALQSLDLSETGVKDLLPLLSLLSLQSLNLHDCRAAPPAAILQSFSDHPCLSELIVGEGGGVPREVLSHDRFDNCLPRLRTYFSELDLGAEAENEVKVILLGNGRVGKTQLCRRFRGESFDDSVPSTHGIQIWREELRLQAEGEEKVFQVNWWDFGGQDIYHGTHALFLRSRAVFLILWTPTLENRDEYSENGIPLRNQPIQYWLDYVRTLAGEVSPVIVVQSQCDRFSDRRPDPPRPDGSGFFECCAYSAREDLGRETLESHLRNAIRYLLKRSGALEIGRGRAEVRRRLYEWRSEDQTREPEERQHRTLTLDEFRALCDETGGIVSWEHALDYCHHTGVVFYQPDLFSSGIILDQDWALDAIYTVFHRGLALSWLRERGRFTRQDLAMTVWQEHSPEEQRLFLGLMKSCGVCFRCGETAEGEARYIAPDLLPRFAAVSSRVDLFWIETSETLTLRLKYRFFHPAVIRGLMSEIGQRAGDLGEYWNYGLWFKDGQRDAQLLVQFVDTSTDEAPGAGTLVLKAQGRAPSGLLREIRRTILRRRNGEASEELLTLNGATVARSAMATLIDGDRVLDTQNQLVPAAAFADFFSDLEHQPEKTRDDGQRPGIDINPQPLKSNEKLPEVFISYAWGDKTPEGKIRARTADRLYSALKKYGFRPARDRDQMHPGERISAFIRQLTRADLVVAVISDKYLHSTYCMYEIYKLWQKCQGDADDLLQSVVPIVLPEVRIGSVRERLPYLRYWAEEAESLEALIRDPKISPSRESWEEVRLVREFAQHVDGILVFLQDVLMPRKLEVHLDDGFRAVREALWRRVGESAGDARRS